jgi:hypothetical protein
VVGFQRRYGRRRREGRECDRLNAKVARQYTNPRLAAHGRGRVQLEVLWLLVDNPEREFAAGEIGLDEKVFGYAGYTRRERLNCGHYQQLRRILPLFADRTSRAPTRGRPWRWRLKPSIAAEVAGSECGIMSWWQDYIHPFQAQRRREEEKAE